MKQRILAFLAVLVLLPGLAQAKIFLVDTDDTLRVVTASGVSTIHMYAAWADLTTTALTPGNSDAQVTTATTTVLVAAPAASTQRQVKGLSIRNAHASSSNAITVEFFDGTTATELIKYTLLAGETLQWGEDENFRVIDASGQVKGLVAATQSGTWNITNVSGTISLPTGAATAALQDGIIKDGTGDTTQANVSNGRLQVENYNANLAADNSTLSTAKVPVIAGTVSTSAPTWTNGNQSALSLQTDGSVRSAVTNSVTIGTFPDNEPFNIAQINGVTPLMGAGNTGTGSPRVTIATDQSALNGMGIYVEDAAETAGGNLSMAGTVRRDTAASSAGTTGDNATLNTDGIGRLWVREGSPCADHARITSAVISESTAATNEIVALNGSDLIYVCGYKWVTTAATSLNWKYGTGTDCATGTTSIEGAQPFAANGGVVENGGGYPLFIVPAGNALCLTSSAATAHGGRVTYVRTAAP